MYFYLDFNKVNNTSLHISFKLFLCSYILQNRLSNSWCLYYFKFIQFPGLSSTNMPPFYLDSVRIKFWLGIKKNCYTSVSKIWTLGNWKLEIGDIGGPWLTLVGRNQMIKCKLSPFTSRCSQSTSIFPRSSLSAPRPKPMKEYISFP